MLERVLWNSPKEKLGGTARPYAVIIEKKKKKRRGGKEMIPLNGKQGTSRGNDEGAASPNEKNDRIEGREGSELKGQVRKAGTFRTSPSAKRGESRERFLPEKTPSERDRHCKKWRRRKMPIERRKRGSGGSSFVGAAPGGGGATKRGN